MKEFTQQDLKTVIGAVNNNLDIIILFGGCKILP